MMKKDNSKAYEVITTLSCIVALATIGYIFHYMSPLLIKISMPAAVFGLVLWVLVVLGIWTNVVKLIALIQEK